MLHENECAAIGGGLGCLPDYLASAPAARGLAPLLPAFDATVLFLSSRLLAATLAMRRAAPFEQAGFLHKIHADAHAMAVIPSRGRLAIDAKIRAAQWSVDFGTHCVRLDSDLARALKASADRDRFSA